MALTQNEINALYAEVLAEWNQAEETVKAAEHICAEAVFPSIKEFRYAGRRIMDSFHELANGSDQGKIESFVKDAVFNCHCARHDAIDVATAQIASNLDIVVKKLGYSPVTQAFPRFSDLSRALSEVRAKIRASRSNRTNRNDIYDAIRNTDLPSIAAMYEEFQAAESIMKSMAGKERQERLFLRISTAISVLVAVGSFLFGVLKRPDCPTLTLPKGAVVMVPSPATQQSAVKTSSQMKP